MDNVMVHQWRATASKQATENKELKAEQHSESHEPDLRNRNKRDQPNWNESKQPATEKITIYRDKKNVITKLQEW